jgi:hypothetical protein
MTMKGDELTVEFRNLLNKAAARQGLTQASFVVDAVPARAVIPAPDDDCQMQLERVCLAQM